jgi:hypothetical protein
MFSTLRTRFGIPGVISVIALVFALVGGAYAANNSTSGGKATASKSKAKKGPRGPKGATGPAGAQGPAGAKGDAGAAGSNGANGTNGTSAEAVSFSGAKGGCAEGGIEVKSAKPAAFVCNGKKGENGQTGFTDTLPKEKTETGTFAYTANLSAGSATARAPISFSIPLAAPLADGHVHLIIEEGTEEIVFNETTEEFEAVAPTGCGSALNPPGTNADPRAAAGNLCVYLVATQPPLVRTGFSEVHLASNYITDPSSTCDTLGCLPLLGGPGDGAGTTGAILQVAQGGSGTYFAGSGTWAVTAP